MGVMADLSGTPAEPLPDLNDREFLEIDVDNFDARLKKMKPRLAFRVPNTLSDEGGNLNVELTFASMDDFSPAAIAQRVEPLANLLKARGQLDSLLTYMDGKAGAERLIEMLIQDKGLQQELKQVAAQRVATKAADDSKSSSEPEKDQSDV
jgi:type VI secretion system protein ImpB